MKNSLASNQGSDSNTNKPTSFGNFDINHDYTMEEAKKVKPYVTINELSKGGYFGEIALMTKLKRTCSVFAINNIVVGVVSKNDFIKLTETSTDFRHRVFNKIASYKD